MATAIFVAAAGAVVGALAGGIEHDAAVSDANLNITRIEDMNKIKTDAAEASNELLASQTLDSYDTSIAAAQRSRDLSEKAAQQSYDIQLAQNVNAQGENRRQTNQRVVDTQQQSLLTGGTMSSTLSGSGVRKTGSASNLLSENTRLYNVNVDEQGKTLAAQEIEYGLGRTAIAAEKTNKFDVAGERFRTTEEGAQLGVEHTLEGITRTDLDSADIFGDGGLDSFIDSMNFEDTLLNETLDTELGFLRTDRDTLKNQQLQYIGAGAIEGASWGAAFL